MTLERRIPLKRTPFKRKPAKQRTSKPPNRSVQKQERNNNFSAKVKRAVTARCFGCCEVRLPGCTGRLEQFHHRLMRSAGGPGTTENCCGICGPCHTRVHGNPSWSYRHGMLVRRGRKPFEITPVAFCALDCQEDHIAQ